MPKQPSKTPAPQTPAIGRDGPHSARYAALAPTLLAAALLAAFAGPAPAQERSADQGDSPHTLAPVIVTATRVALNPCGLGGSNAT